MPFDNFRDHFSALDRAIGNCLSDGKTTFLRGPEREEFCKDAEILRKEIPQVTVPLPSAKDSNTYITAKSCKLCPLQSASYASANGLSLWRSGIYGRGTGKNGIYIVGDTPDAFDIVNDQPFSGAAGTILSRALKKVGIVEEDCFITNIIRCRLDDKRNPKAAEVVVCQDYHFAHDLPYGYYDGYGMGEQRDEWNPEWRPKLIIVLGLQALKHMMKMQKITANRGVFFDYTFIDTPIKFIATWHPFKLLLSPELLTDFEEDLEKAQRFIENDAVVVPPIQHVLINSSENYVQWMGFILDNLPNDIRLSIDLETTGLNYREDEIASVAITFTHNSQPYGISFLVEFHEKSIPLNSHGWWRLDLDKRDTVEYQALKLVLETYPLTFQNGDFDVKFLWEVGIHAVNECDTIDAHLMLNEEGPHNLEYLVKAYIGDSGGYKEKFKDGLEDKGSFYLANPVDLLTYNIDDTYYTQLLREKFIPLIKKEGMTDLFWNHAMPLQRTLSRMSYRGVRVDRQILMDLASDNRAQIKQLVKDLYAEVGEFNFSSAPAIRNLLYNKLKLPILKETKKTNLPATDKDVLKMLGMSHHIPKMILDIRKLAKQNSTYLDGDDGLPKKVGKTVKEKGILQFLDGNDRVHAHFFPWGTVSGRLSASRPNILNIPKDSVFRNLFIPSDGYVFVDADYSQAELIALAYLCQDSALIAAVNSSDLHSKVVQDLLGISPDDPEYVTKRTVAKQINFGKVYGAGPKRLVEQLKYEAGIELPLEEAQVYHEKWDRLYPGVKEWAKAQCLKWRMNSELVSIFGRKLRFPDLSQIRNIEGQADNVDYLESKKDRLASNFPPQSAVGDATNRALHLLDSALEERYGKWKPQYCLTGPAPILSLHDSVLVETPEELATEVAEMLHEIMLSPLPELNISLKIDMQIKMSWGDKGEKIEF